MNIMKNNEREPYEKEDRILSIFGWVMLIFYILFIIYVKEINEALKNFHINLPKTIIVDLPVVYIVCILLYCHIKYRDKR